MNQGLSVVGIDIAKCVFRLIGIDERRKIILCKRLHRGEVHQNHLMLPLQTRHCMLDILFH